jgi:hypothetical protein
MYIHIGIYVNVKVYNFKYLDYMNVQVYVNV